MAALAPMVIFLVIGLGIVGIIVLLFYLERKRREGIAKIATEMGLEFHPQAHPSLLAELSDFPLMSKGRARRIANVVHGQTDQIILSIFDYQFTTGSGKNSSTSRQTVAFCRATDLQLPQFALRPQHFFHNIGKLFGYTDIDFDTHPTFSKHFILQGANEAAVRELFGPAMLEYFESHLGLCCEGMADTMIIYRASKRASPPDFQEMFRMLLAIHKLVSP